MLKKILTFIQYKTSWLIILGLLAVAGLLTFIMNGTALPFSTPTIEEHTEGVPILDMRMSYTPVKAYQLFTTMGTPGRSLVDPSLLWKTGTDTHVPAAVWQSFCGEIVNSSA